MKQSFAFRHFAFLAIFSNFAAVNRPEGKRCRFGKTVICNCDDPRVSNFSVYFVLNFKALGLKRLITTCYKNNEPDLFSMNECERAVYAIYEGDPECNSPEDAKQIPYHEFEHSDGDFRSPECIELLKQADIVDIREMEADHITPWKDGGRTVASNCQLLCRDCNRRKGAK